MALQLQDVFLHTNFFTEVLIFITCLRGRQWRQSSCAFQPPASFCWMIKVFWLVVASRLVHNEQMWSEFLEICIDFLELSRLVRAVFWNIKICTLPCCRVRLEGDFDLSNLVCLWMPSGNVLSSNMWQDLLNLILESRSNCFSCILSHPPLSKTVLPAVFKIIFQEVIFEG